MKEARPRCSIMWCPWRAKYSFGIKGLHECWFHGRDIPWLNFLWDIFWVLPRYIYYSLRYGIPTFSYPNIINWYRVTWEGFLEDRGWASEN